MSALDKLEQLVKALEAGSYDVAPSKLVQGAALQVEDISTVMQVVTYDTSHIKLQKMLRVESCKSILAQFDRQLDYGTFGGSAQLEAGVGQEETTSYVRVTVPMCFYSHVRRVTLVANLVQTVDGKSAEERAAADAALKIAGDVEHDLFRGKGDFSNAGTFDGNPLTMAALPNILGLEPQVRQSDNQRNTQDLMFSEYGSDQSVVIQGGGVLSQPNIQDAHVRSTMNMGTADRLYMDPITLGNYNQIAYGKERIVLAGSPQDATGADLRRQWVAGGVVTLEAVRFLSGKTSPAKPRPNGPGAPGGVAAAQIASSTSFLINQVYQYYVTAANEIGESVRLPANTVTVTITASGNAVQLTITPPAAGIVRYYNVYRTPAGGSLASAKFIGRVLAAATGNTIFLDLNNKNPGFVTGFLVQGDTMEIRELQGYSRVKLAVTDLSTPEAHFRFLTLAVLQPRKNVLIDNLR